MVSAEVVLSSRNRSDTTGAVWGSAHESAKCFVSVAGFNTLRLLTHRAYHKKLIIHLLTRLIINHQNYTIDDSEDIDPRDPTGGASWLIWHHPYPDHRWNWIMIFLRWLTWEKTKWDTETHKPIFFKVFKHHSRWHPRFLGSYVMLCDATTRISEFFVTAVIHHDPTARNHRHLCY